MEFGEKTVLRRRQLREAAGACVYVGDVLVTANDVDRVDAFDGPMGHGHGLSPSRGRSDRHNDDIT
jgi:hypothetical protein